MPNVFPPGHRGRFLATSAACFFLLASTTAPAVPPVAATPTATAIDTLLKGSFPSDRPGAAVSEMLFFPEGADEPERAPRVADVPDARTTARVDPALYDAYVGDYELAPGFVLTVTREGDRLMTQATGQQKVEVFPSSETEFFLKVVDAQITFVRGPEGKVDQLVLHQGGRDMPAKKRK